MFIYRPSCNFSHEVYALNDYIQVKISATMFTESQIFFLALKIYKLISLPSITEIFTTTFYTNACTRHLDDSLGFPLFNETFF